MPPFHSLSLEQNPGNVNEFLMNALHIVQLTFVLDPKAYPEKIFFPDDVTSFLQSSLKGLIKRGQKLGHNNCRKNTSGRDLSWINYNSEEYASRVTQACFSAINRQTC